MDKETLRKEFNFFMADIDEKDTDDLFNWFYQHIEERDDKIKELKELNGSRKQLLELLVQKLTQSLNEKQANSNKWREIFEIIDKTYLLSKY